MSPHSNAVTVRTKVSSNAREITVRNNFGSAHVTAIVQGYYYQAPPISIVAFDGRPLGTYVGVTSNFMPMVAINDPVLNQPMFLLVWDRNTLRGERLVRYAGSNCSGATFLASQNFELPDLRGEAYGVGPDSIGQMWVYRSTTSSPTSTAYASYFLSGQGCVNDSNSVSAVPATPIINLSFEFPPPYRDWP